MTRVSVKRADYQTRAGSIKVNKMIRHYDGVSMYVQSSTLSCSVLVMCTFEKKVKCARASRHRRNVSDVYV